ncbi:hypothetical protein M409DRAFT_57916 [Zasmidium cellare ATCC 36951]|uniref:Acyltransferase 3 domain-containing protein n=1 Tax=Zasmidium cellare ATCC 36951 TaxID=1080233 RepID=A0A6A6CB30_ZASCE|nr:uncharacterized protein M409DRAFT_57916 [Zasmidium cellare ATCC 36951]KAF2162859.1 hypothetical protein M409DRAFT_57916 [Zasmidium cellare ATCC 36951]
MAAASSSSTLELEEREGHTLPLHNLDTLSRQEDPLDASNNAATTSTARNTASSNNSNNVRNSTAYLDGLRGFAAFLVYFYHHISWFYGPTDDLLYGWGHEGNHYIFQLPFLRVFFTGGNAAVAIFFILSGYVLSLSPLRSLRDGNAKKCYNSLISATIRRPFRLYIPPIGVGLCFAIAMQLPFGLAPRMAWPQPEATFSKEMARFVPETWHMVNPFERHGTKEHWYIYNPPSYTMAIEFVGSMAVFGLCAMFSTVSVSVRAGLFLLAAVTFLSTGEWALAMFMGGVLLAMNDLSGWDHALLAKQPLKVSRTVMHHIFFFTGWYLLCQPSGIRDPKQSSEAPGWYILTELLTPRVYYQDEYWRWWNFWGALMLVYGVLRIEWLQSLFTTQPMRYLGRICFALYLVHTPLLWTINDRVYRVLGTQMHQDLVLWIDDWLKIPDFGIHGLSSRFLVAQVINTPINFAAAEVGTWVLDEPSVRVGKWIVRKLGIDKR